MSTPTVPELYHFPRSLHSRQVRLALAEKGVIWKSKIVNLYSFRNLSPGYRQLNPGAEVPTLVVNGKVIPGWHAILDAIDGQFDGPHLRPADAFLRGLMEYWIEFQDHLALPERIRTDADEGVSGWLAEREIRQEVERLHRLISTHPDLQDQLTQTLKTAQRSRELLENPQALESLKAAAEPILDTLEETLQDQEFLCGGDYTLADTIWTTIMLRLEELGLASLWDPDQRPQVSAYYQRLQARPSFAKAIKRFDSSPVMLPLIVKGVWSAIVG